MKKAPFFIAIPFMVLSIFDAFYGLKSRTQNIPINPVSEINSIEGIIIPYIENKRTKGLSIGTYKNGKIQFHNFGICSDKNPVAPTQQSIYEIGSITKTFTASVLAQMAQEGKVKYDDPISKYLPEEVINWTEDVAITLEELSTHSSGLPRLPSNILKRMILNMDNPYKNYTVEDMYDFLKGFKSVPKANRKVEYSNLGVGLLGHILALVDNLSYEEMVQKRIFQPLAMNASLIKITEGQMIQGHNAGGVPTSQWDLPTFAGAGAIRSNTTDMMKYLQANINEEVPYVLTHAPRKDYTKTQKIGLAWISKKEQESEMEILWHNGGTGGFRTYIGFSKVDKVGVVVLSNACKSVDELGLRILQLLEKDK